MVSSGRSLKGGAGQDTARQVGNGRVCGVRCVSARSGRQGPVSRGALGKFWLGRRGVVSWVLSRRVVARQARLVMFGLGGVRQRR